MASKTEIELAYAAGRHVMSEPPERRSVDGCPFAEGTDAREAWLDGFSDALDEQEDLTATRKALKAARGNND